MTKVHSLNLINDMEHTLNTDEQKPDELVLVTVLIVPCLLLPNTISTFFVVFANLNC